MRSIRFSLKKLHLWVALYAALLAILLFAGYAAISMYVSMIAMFLFLLAHEYFCSSKNLSLFAYVGTYSLAMAASIGVAFWALANVESAPRGDGFLAAFIYLADTSRTILISYYLIGFFLLIAVLVLTYSYIKSRKGISKAANSEN